MTVEKNDKLYDIKEHTSHWSVKCKNDKLTVVFNIGKNICQTADDIKAYISNKNDTF